MSGHHVETTEHPDGRKDVTVSVKSLDVDLSDPKNAEAKKVIEEQVFPAIANKKITCTLIHKPTNDHFSFVTSRQNVRANAEVAVKQHANAEMLEQVDLSQYCLVENDGDGHIQVTSL